MKTLITWPHDSTEGQRAGTRLHEKFPGGSIGVSAGHIEELERERFELLIVVGHHHEITVKATLDALIYSANVREIPYVALVDIGHAGEEHESGKSAESTALWDAAQHFADEMGAAVLAPMREFSFDDVAEARVFAGNETGIKPINPGGIQVWKEFRRGEREEHGGEGGAHA